MTMTFTEWLTWAAVIVAVFAVCVIADALLDDWLEDRRRRRLWLAQAELDRQRAEIRRLAAERGER